MYRPWLTVLTLQALAAALGWGKEIPDRPLSEIHFQPELPAGAQVSAEQALTVSVGQPLDHERLRESIQALFRTGRFADIQADLAPAADGMRLTFLVEPAWFVGNVQVEGVPRPPSEGQLLNATKLRLGELFTDAKLAEARRSLRALLLAQGFREPAVAHSLDRDPSSQQVHVSFQVAPGERASFGAILVTGSDPPLPASEIRRIARWPRDAAYRSDRLQRGLGRLRKHFQDQGFWRAVIRVEPAEYRPAENEITLVVAIDPGPRMSVRVDGATIGDSDLRRYLPVLTRGADDDDLIAAGSVNLQSYLQSRGYLDASVRHRVDRNPTEKVDIIYTVDRGRRQSLRHIEIAGNRRIDTLSIRERIQLRAFDEGRGKGLYSRALLEEDMRAIRELYRSSGFREVKVSGALGDAGDGKEHHRAVRIAIEEGEPTLVSGLVTSGLAHFPADERTFEFASAPGRPYSEANILSDRRRILGEFYNAGYRDATFAWRSEDGQSPGEMVVYYDIDHGRRVLVGETIVSGTRKTRASLLERQIELRPGAPLSQADIFATQRNLYDLGVFSKVDVALLNPDGEEAAKDVLLHVEEARRWAVGTGGGAEFARIGRNTAELTNPAGDATFSPRATLEVTRLNVRGKAHTVSLRTRLSLLQQRGLFAYEAPRVFDSDRWKMTLNGLYDTFRNVNTFTGRRLEGAFQLTQTLSESTTALYRYAYRRTSIDQNTLNIEPLLVPLVSQPVRVGLLSGTLISDRRDDPTDTSSGIYNTMNVALAARPLGSQPSFVRMLARNSTYHQVRSGVVFARTVQIGVNVPWSGGPGSAPATDRFLGRPDPRIPLSERYFGGGANSHRGFAYNQAGPRDPSTGFPLGGGSEFLNSVELRFPLGSRDLSGVVFHDAGNVYSRASRISFRPSQRIRVDEAGVREFDFDYMVHALGLGIRYRTPIGPVRFDLAYSPNPPRFVGFDGTRRQLLTGTGSFREQRIRSLQFHFSLGQTF